MADLFLSRSYTYSSQILILFGFLVCCTKLIHVCILISSLYLFRSPEGVTEPMLIQRYRTHNYPTEFTLVRKYPKVSQRLRNVYRYCRTYSYTEVLVSTTELILILRSIYWSYRTWTCISDLRHVLQSIYLSYGSYTGLTELILVLRILYWSYRTYTCLTELILVLRILCVYYTT